MPLNRLVPALLRLVSAGPRIDSGPSSETEARHHRRRRLSAARLLQDDLVPLLQTPRSIAQKYRTRVAKLLLLDDEDAETDGGGEDEVMWYALKHDKAADAGEDEDEDEEAVEERWRKTLLDRMERRESVWVFRFSCFCALRQACA